VTAQWIAVAIIVPLCTVYAIWNLLGGAGRRRIAAWLARGRWPTAWQRRLANAGAGASACGCDGCDKPGLARTDKPSVANSDKPAAARSDEPTQTIVQIHRRR